MFFTTHSTFDFVCVLFFVDGRVSVSVVVSGSVRSNEMLTGYDSSVGELLFNESSLRLWWYSVIGPCLTFLECV